MTRQALSPAAARIVDTVEFGLGFWDTDLESCESCEFARLLGADDLAVVAASLGLPYVRKSDTSKAVLAALRA